MSSVFVIVREKGPKQSAQMVFAEDDDMIGTFAPNTPMCRCQAKMGPLLGLACEYPFQLGTSTTKSEPFRLGLNLRDWIGSERPVSLFKKCMMGIPFRSTHHVDESVDWILDRGGQETLGWFNEIDGRVA